MSLSWLGFRLVFVSLTLRNDSINYPLVTVKMWVPASEVIKEFELGGWING